MSFPSQGVLYVATGDRWIKEAIHSATSLKKVMPNTPVALRTDSALRPEIFDEIIPTEKPSDVWLYKIEQLAQTPFDRTLFIDTDTYVAADLSELFDTLDWFDFAAAWEDSSAYGHPKAPSFFPCYNTGVIVFRKNKAMQAVLTDWAETFRGYRRTEPPNSQIARQDQPALQATLYKHTDVRILTLPANYNFRGFKFGVLHNAVKVVHARAEFLEEFEAIANTINRTSHWPKLFIGWDMLVRVKRDNYVVAADVLKALGGPPNKYILSLRGLLKRYGPISWVKRLSRRIVRNPARWTRYG